MNEFINLKIKSIFFFRNKCFEETSVFEWNYCVIHHCYTFFIIETVNKEIYDVTSRCSSNFLSLTFGFILLSQRPVLTRLTSSALFRPDISLKNIDNRNTWCLISWHWSLRCCLQWKSSDFLPSSFWFCQPTPKDKVSLLSKFASVNCWFFCLNN